MSQVRGSAAFLITLFVAAIAVMQIWTPPAPVPFRPIGAKEVPLSVAGYVAAESGASSVSDQARQVLAAASITSRLYMPGENGVAGSAPIEFILIGGTDRSALHDPRSCLTGSGWTIKDDRATPFAAAGRTIPAHTCRIVNETLPDKPAFDLLYLYVVDGKVIESVTQIRAQMLASAVIGRKNTPVYFLRFLRAVEDETHTPNETVPSSPVPLGQFARAMWQELALGKP